MSNECIREITEAPLSDRARYGRNPYQPQPLDEEQQLQIAAFRREFWFLHRRIMDTLPPGRYRAMALTSLEEVANWTIKGLAFDGVAG